MEAGVAAMKIIFGLPCRTYTTINLMGTMLQAMSTLKNAGHEVDLVVSANQPVDLNLEKITRIALEKGFDYLLYCSDDQYFRGEDILKMISYDKEWVSPIICRKAIPFAPVLFDCEKGLKIFDYPKDRLFKAFGPLCLVKRSVFDKLKERHPGERLFLYTEERSEDLYFMHHCKEAGVEPWVDPTINFAHYGVPAEIWMYEHFKDEFIKQLKDGLEEKDGLLVAKNVMNFTAQTPSGHQVTT